LDKVLTLKLWKLRLLLIWIRAWTLRRSSQRHIRASILLHLRLLWLLLGRSAEVLELEVEKLVLFAIGLALIRGGRHQSEVRFNCLLK